MNILLLNPNRTQAVTDVVLAAAESAAAPGTRFLAVTGRRGPAVISTRSENAIAHLEVMALAAEYADQVDAIILAVSLDTALSACREMLGAKPVIGMTEAGLLMAATLATRIGVMTYGPRMGPIYRELVASHGFTDRLAGVEALPVTPTDTFTAPGAVRDAVVGGVQRLVERDGAEAVVLAGAAMASMARELQPRCPVPLLDGVACAVMLAEARVRMALPGPTTGSLSPVSGRDLIGVGDALAARLKGSA